MSVQISRDALKAVTILIKCHPELPNPYDLESSLGAESSPHQGDLCSRVLPTERRSLREGTAPKALPLRGLPYGTF